MHELRKVNKVKIGIISNVKGWADMMGNQYMKHKKLAFKFICERQVSRLKIRLRYNIVRGLKQIKIR